MNIKKIKYLFITIGLIFSAVATFMSCSEDTVIDRVGAARILPSITVDPTLIVGSGQQQDISPAPLPSELSFTLSADDGKYEHTWVSVDDYPTDELLRPGLYTASVSFGNEMNEGFNCPYFHGMNKINLQSGDEVECPITATLASAVYNTSFSDKLKSGFKSVSAIFHSDGYSYLTVDENEFRPLFLHPGNTEVFLQITTSSGQEANIKVAEIKETEARHLYDIDFDSDGQPEPTITVSANNKAIAKTTLTDALINAPAPLITPSGFSGGTALTLPEGDIPKTPLVFNLSGAEASSIVLTTMAPSINSQGWPSKIDLATASPEELSVLMEMGLIITRSSSGTISSVDITEVASRLRYSPDSPDSRFIMITEDINHKASKPCELKIRLQPVEISVVSVSDVMIGVNMAEMVILSRTGNIDRNLVIEANKGGAWQTCAIESIEQRPNSEYAVRFIAPEGAEEKLPVRIIYCGNILADATLMRVSPKFSISADAFALSSVLRIDSDRKEMLPLITSLLKIYVNGSQAVSVRRIPESASIYVGNLQPMQKYILTATMFDNPEQKDFCTPVEITTENTAQPQNNDFEDHGGGIKYDRLPCGGRYSQSILDIFNRQNFTSFNLSEPSYWTTVNPKTFCLTSTNPNTWYMTPSTFSEVDNVEGYFAVKLQSVAWDNTGEEITPYRQKADQYLDYNPNIPSIKYRAAGKAFLGGYRFDPKTLEEHYDEGINFASRPAAVNGNYHFTPSPADLNDCGRVIVEVRGIIDGKEEVIASNSVLLPAALTYTAFSVPLSYKHFGVKATKLSIMLSSSRYVGTIEYESSHIKTYSDPKAATSIGGELWVEDLQLSYF